MTNLVLLSATVEHLVALRDDPSALADPEDGPIWRWELALTAC